ncbi:MAG: phosphoribosylaminoimidazolecarboxamide formyltransferase [Oscillospiraceae bacterium]|nr:phosphoribosylaminoimidazolecarboxamide formyltransferase [Oscillospiraceae bacterium]
MTELELKYGCNPNQKPSRIFMDTTPPFGHPSTEGNLDLPIEILGGKPGYINFMDALNGWQLVKELKQATGQPAAASFKHVSPAGAAIGATLLEAYQKARNSDPVSSYGDFIALSDKCDAETANFIKPYVSDGVIAPDFESEALEILKAKRNGSYNVIKIASDYIPKPIERRDIYGITFEQGRNELLINDTLLQNVVTANKDIPDSAKADLLIALITLKYTQSNSVAYAFGGQAIGIGAGQQSRIHCTRLAGQKADNWYLRQHEKVLGLPFAAGLKPADKDNAIDIYISDDYEDILDDGAWQRVFTRKPDAFMREEKRAWLGTMSGIALGSDAFFPFGDNIERASKSGVKYIAQPGGSVRDDNVIEVCNKYGMAMAFTGIRLFHH